MGYASAVSAGAKMPSDLLARAVAASPLSLLVVDRAGIVLTANEAGCDLFGRPEREILGHALEGFVDPSQRPEVATLLRLARDGGDPKRQEIRFGRPDGQQRVGGFSVARMDGDEELLVVVIRDITGEVTLRENLVSTEASVRRQLREVMDFSRDAEDARRRIEAVLRLVLDTVPEMVLVHRAGRVVYVNELSVRALGHHRADDLLGRLVLDLTHPDDRAGIAEWMRRVAEGGKPESPPGHRMLRRDGTWAEVEVVGMPIVFDAAPALLTLGRDATERKRLQAGLAVTDRLASLGVLAAGVAHEINNPLGFVMASLEMLGEELRSIAPLVPVERVADLEGLVRDARQGADRVRRIVRGMRTFSRGDAPTLVTLDLRGVLELSIGMVKHSIDQRARLVREIGAVPLVRADEARLGQVFTNLLMNAVQAIAGVDVAANAVRVVTRTDEEGRAVVEVHDTGAGIPAAVRGRIFDLFFTTKEVGEGTGLGLSICHEIVTGLGGTIEVESVEGGGSTFRVVLPPASGPAKVKSEPVGAPDTSTTRRGRVLVVDDDAMSGKAIARVLGGENDVRAVTSGAEALSILRGGAVFDVVLCDLMMPQMTGMDLHAILLAEAAEVAGRMVFITGGAFTSEGRTFLDTVPNQHVDKPFGAQHLRGVVRAMVR